MSQLFTKTQHIHAVSLLILLLSGALIKLILSFVCGLTGKADIIILIIEILYYL